MNYYDPLVHQVTSAEEGWLLDTVLRKSMLCSRRLVSQLKRTEKGLMLNGERVYTNRKVTGGDRVEVYMVEEYSEDILPQSNIPIDIIYEDEALLILNKPAGIIVHPTVGHYQNTLANGVVYYWQQKALKYRFRAVHRLDEDTSGVIAIAKNPYIQSHISEQMHEGEVHKEYVALVHGLPPQKKGRIVGAITRDTENPHVRVVREDGDHAATRYQVIEQYGEKATLLKLWLETGRTHQIRVHMKHMGCPIIGDRMYGSLEKDHRILSPDIDLRQALHAQILIFQHPMMKKEMVFEAPLPVDFQLWLKGLKRL